MMKFIKVLPVIGMVLSLFFMVVCSKKAGSISGTVENVAGEPLMNVSVYIPGSESTETNTSGEYLLDGLDMKEHLVCVSKDGYLNRSSYVDIADQQNATKDFTLEIQGWIGTWFSGSYGCNFTENGASLGPTNLNTDFDFDGTNLTTPNVTDGILDLGTNLLGNIGTVPTTGYNSATTAYAGNCYAIRTTEGNYVKLRTTSLSSGDQMVMFDWVYQSNGTPQFVPGTINK